MSKVVPFVRRGSGDAEQGVGRRSAVRALREAVLEDVGGCQLEAEELIATAAQLISTEKVTSRVPWLLEDCLELLKSETQPPAAKQNKTSAQQDPRHILNTHSELSSIIRKK